MAKRKKLKLSRDQWIAIVVGVLVLLSIGLSLGRVNSKDLEGRLQFRDFPQELTPDLTPARSPFKGKYDFPWKN